MFFISFFQIAVIQMTEHDVYCADWFEIPVGGAVHSRYCLHCIRILPKVTVRQNSAVMVCIILSVRVIFSVTEIGTDSFVREQ